jgi:ankyrin repeat protein
MSEEQRSIGLEDLLETGNIARLFKQREDAVDVVMKLLSETHVNLMESKPDGSSLLHSFAMFGCYEVVKLLWERGVRPTIHQADNTSLLHSAVRTQEGTQDEERARILRFFLVSGECYNNSMPLDLQNSQGWTALKLAARKNLEKCVEVLIDHDANPDLPDHEAYTALHNAVGNPDILKMLSTKSKNLNAQNKDGETPLYLAAERGLAESALMLLEYGADPNTPNKEGIVPLFLAARGGHLELVRGLLKNKAAVNFQGAQQNIAPLHWAAHKEREDIALLLIENGADILLKDKEGRMPLSMAAPDLAAKMTKAALMANPSLCLPSHTAISPCMSAHQKAMAACCSGNVPALKVSSENAQPTLISLLVSYRKCIPL